MANQGKGGARVNQALQKSGQWAERIPSAPPLWRTIIERPVVRSCYARHSGVGYDIDRRFMAESNR